MKQLLKPLESKYLKLFDRRDIRIRIPFKEKRPHILNWAKYYSEPLNVGLEPFDETSMNDTREWWQKNSLVLQGLMSISSITGAEGPIRKAVQTLLESNIILAIGPQEMVNYDKSYWSHFEQKEEILFPNNPTFTKWLKE